MDLSCPDASPDGSIVTTSPTWSKLSAASARICHLLHHSTQPLLDSGELFHARTARPPPATADEIWATIEAERELAHEPPADQPFRIVLDDLV